jgi:ubiquinone biosynthesis protein COQ9
LYPTQTPKKNPLLFQSFSTTIFSEKTTDPVDSNKATVGTTSKDSLSTIRLSILKSALEQVHHHGWTDDALAAGAVAVRKNNNEMSISVVGMISLDDLIAYCMDEWNVRLKQDLEQEKQQQQHNAKGDALETGIKTRLQYLLPYLQSRTWHEGMALGIRGPSNAFQTQQQLKEMIEIIVVASSASTEELGLPQKMALGAVYVATELHLLTDTSPDYQDTWTFLSHRMDDWRRLTGSSLVATGTTTTSSSYSSHASDVLFVTSTVASSLLGGLISLVMHHPTNQPFSKLMMTSSFGLPDAVWSSLFQNSPSWGTTTTSTTTASRKEGTDPSDYDAKQKS